MNYIVERGEIILVQLGREALNLSRRCGPIPDQPPQLSYEYENNHMHHCRLHIKWYMHFCIFQAWTRKDLGQEVLPQWKNIHQPQILLMDFDTQGIVIAYGTNSWQTLYIIEWKNAWIMSRNSRESCAKNTVGHCFSLIFYILRLPKTWKVTQ